MTRIDELVAEHLRWGMHFSPELEREYRSHHAQRSISPLRNGLVIIFLLLLIAALPWMPDPEMRRVNTIVCLAVLAPAVFLTILASRYYAHFSHYSQIVMSTLAVVISFSFLIVQHIGPTEFYVRQSVIPSLFVIFGVFTIARLRFWNAVFTAALVSFLSLYWIHSVRPLPADVELEKTVYLGFAYILGLAAAYPTDRALRRDFLLSRLLAEEKDRSETLLANVLPEPIAEELKHGWGVIAESHESATVLFADVVNFTPFAATQPPDKVVGFLNGIFSKFDGLVERHGLEKIKTVGDAYMVAGGLPKPRANHLEAMALLALDMHAVMASTVGPDGSPMKIRIGIHTGPLVAGVIGTRKFLYDLWGDTVNTASRMESHGIGGQIQVTEEVVRALEDRFEFERRGLVQVKGKGEICTFWLVGRKQISAEGASAEFAVTSPGPSQ
ncbi:MAG: adenylate cyclase [Fimbriimonadaceae bacterium]|jgi:class 3 adenylate cyclase|nr:adenylate cyclase [Fimbriimonadaceae bacterium]